MTMSFKPRWPLASAVLLGLGSSWVLPSDALFGPDVARAQSLPGFLKRDKDKADKAASNDAAKKPQSSARVQTGAKPLGALPEKQEPEIKLNFSAQNWDVVLKKVADDCGSTLVMDRVPKGRFTRTEFTKKYTREEALRILNRELESQDFRVVEQGNFLVVMYLPNTRPDYRRHQIAPEATEPAQKTPQGAPVAGVARTGTGNRVQQAGGQRPVQGPARDSGIRTANFQGDDAPAVKNAAETTPVKSYKPKRVTSEAIAKSLLASFNSQAKVLENAIDGLPGLRIYKLSGNPNAPREVWFTLGVDTGNNELFVEASGEEVERIVRLVQRFDAPPLNDGEVTKIVTTTKNPATVVKNVNTAVAKMIAQNDGQPNEAKTETNRKDADGNPLPSTVAGVRGEVTVEVMENGIIILKGNQADVDAVLAVIEEIEKLSATTAPNVHVQTLKHVDGVALAELLTSVYDKLKEARGSRSDQEGTISIIGVVRPNAVLVVASDRDLGSVTDLITELDKPVPPQAAFAVFSLEHAIASQVELMLTDFYTKTGNITERGGLGTKIRIVADVRTNQVIVFAQPSDLREISKLVTKLDRSESGAVSQVQFFNLNHSVADDMAQTLNLIFQSVLNPAQLGQGQLGQQVLGIGGGNSSAQLKEVRSSILEYLGTNGTEQRKYRSGILADIRVSGDNRSNTLIVTAPRESMELIQSLIERLDRPTSNAAEIKHFSLRNADASSVVTLLNQLFNGQQQQGGGGGGLNNQNNQQPLGIQLAAAQDASSVVPLRFSGDVRTNSVVAIGTAEALEVVEALMLRLDEGEVRERKMKVFRLKNTESPIVAQAIQQFMTSQVQLLQQQTGGQQGGGLISAFELIEKQIIVQSEQSTNSILISASPRYYEEIVKMIESLDENLPQVIIQALLVEVTLDNTDEFGVELGFQDPILFNRSAVANGVLSPGFGFNSATIGNSIGQVPTRPDAHPAGVGAQGLGNLGVGRTNADGLGFGGLVLSAGSDSVSVLLRALAYNRKLEILSRPQIRTLHNQIGYINVGQQIPIVTGTQSNGTTGFFSPQISQQQVGITLEVIPKVGPDGKIQMQLQAIKTIINGSVAIVGASAGQAEIRSPIIDGTTARATITVSDSETIVLGGLITKTNDTLERKVPWLGDLPVVGTAFRYDKSVQQRKELLIFLTPHVIKNSADNEMIKQIEACRLHWTECEAEEVHGPIFGVPAELMDPVVAPNHFDSLSEPVAPVTPVTPTPPRPVIPNPPAPAGEGAPMTRRTRDTGVRQVSHQEPPRTNQRAAAQPRKREE